MLRWGAIFFIIGIFAAILGFGGIAEETAFIAQVFFVILLIGFIVVLAFGSSIFKED